MFRHVVMFSWGDRVDSDHVARAAEALSGLPDRIPQIVAFAHGPDAGLDDSNFDYAVVADFASRHDYLVYRDHPDHRALVAEYLAGWVSARVAVQHELLA